MLRGRHLLVIDDSRVQREVLRDLLVFEGATVDLAEDPYAAVPLLQAQCPDAIVLDLEMPRMSGLAFLRRLMAQHPLPVVVVSGAVGSDGEKALQALEAGALEVVAKAGDQAGDALRWRQQTLGALERAVEAGVHPNGRRRPVSKRARVPSPEPGAPSQRLVAIGASTGGTRALAEFLQHYPSDGPGLVMVQHMPPAFTAPFAEHLDRLGVLRVQEARTGDVVRDGLALLAPGGRHLLVLKHGGHFVVEVREGPTVNRHRPSVDVLFRSVAQSAGRRAVGVILTGMGDDGARCLKEMHDTGATTFAQDEATCVVFGMPKEAIRWGGVDQVLPLPQLGAAAGRAALSKLSPLVA